MPKTTPAQAVEASPASAQVEQITPAAVPATAKALSSTKAAAPAKATMPKATPGKAAPAAAPVAKAKVAVETKKTAKTKPVKAPKEKKMVVKKPKLVRDSFTFPESDYALIATLKQRALSAGCEAKKSEVLRAALVVLSGFSEQDLVNAINSIDKLKPGRPAK